MLNDDQSLDITALRDGYARGAFTPEEVIDLVLGRIAAGPPSVWISALPRKAMLDHARALRGQDIARLPLYGVPFAIKDNIDLAGLPTTAGCAEYAYAPTRSAFVVERLIAAGALPIGKTNLDQFATGLVGTRSPWGACPNAFDPHYISGGSSSGSALAVALGQTSFALGTDTAGSGRVPAAFNNLVGLKPTRGRLSTNGVVPACRTLDCVSVFALTAEDARRVFDVAAVFDDADPYARRITSARGIPRTGARFGTPRTDQLEWFGNADYARLFEATARRLESLGLQRHEIDCAPFLDAARLLYEGPWVAERHAAIRDFIERDADALLPVTRGIIEPAHELSAVAAFEAQYRLAALARAAEPIWHEVDLMLMPTAGTHYRIDEVLAEPLALNANLGRYTNFMNLLDLAAVAVPAGFTAAGLPFGVTLFAPAFNDRALLELGARLHRSLDLPAGATGAPLPAPTASGSNDTGRVQVAVCGAHMQGLPLNHQLTERGGELVARTRTAPNYRLYALPGGPPQRPGLVRVDDGAAIEVEVWSLPVEHYGSFVAGIPAPLGIGTLTLADGSTVQGFLCEAIATRDAEDVTRFGGWRGWLKG
ncbi:MAG: allophanate hydrolase [Chromatiales bacterium]|nr:allophanate hydrolase [Chromatiales bacterium]